MNLYSLTLEEENDSQNAFGEHYCMIASIQLEKSGGNTIYIRCYRSISGDNSKL